MHHLAPYPRFPSAAFSSKWLESHRMPQICTPPDGWRGNRLLPRDARGWRQAVGVASRSVTGFPAADMKLASETPPRASETAGETRVPSPVEHLKDMAL